MPKQRALKRMTSRGLERARFTVQPINHRPKERGSNVRDRAVSMTVLVKDD